MIVLVAAFYRFEVSLNIRAFELLASFQSNSTTVTPSSRVFMILPFPIEVLVVKTSALVSSMEEEDI